MHTVVRRVRSFLEGVQWEQGVVLAVSGGPDSVALLRAFLTLSPTPPPPLVVAHLNHMLRGPDSDADEAFVRELHARLAPARPRLELCCERIDVGQRAKREAANLEQLARKVRYG